MGKADFQLHAPVTRIWKADDGVMHWEGVASSTAVDHEKQRVTLKGLDSMTAAKAVPLVAGHSVNPLDELGEVVEFEVTDKQLRCTGTLDADNPEATRIFNRAQAGKKHELSVGGRVGHAFWEFDEKAKANIKNIDNIVLNHVALVRAGTALNPDTHFNVLAKAADAILTEEGAEMGTDPVELGEETQKGLAARFADAIKGVVFVKAEDTDKGTEEPAETKPAQVTPEQFNELNTKVDGIVAAINALAAPPTTEQTTETEEDEKPTEPKPQDKPAEQVAAAEEPDLAKALLVPIMERVAKLEGATDLQKGDMAAHFGGIVRDLTDGIKKLDDALGEHNRTEHAGKSQALETPIQTSEELAKSEETRKNDAWSRTLKL